jgi:hypothetical protein
MHMSFESYLSAMKDFMPVIAAWADEARELAAAAATKPELAQGEQVVGLARRGRSIVADLAGTGEQAPTAMRASHDKLVASIEGVSAAAQAGGAGFTAAAGGHLETAGSAMMALRSVLDRGSVVPGVKIPGFGASDS